MTNDNHSVRVQQYIKQMITNKNKRRLRRNQTNQTMKQSNKFKSTSIKTSN